MLRDLQIPTVKQSDLIIFPAKRHSFISPSQSFHATMHKLVFRWVVTLPVLHFVFLLLILTDIIAFVSFVLPN